MRDTDLLLFVTQTDYSDLSIKKNAMEAPSIQTKEF